MMIEIGCRKISYGRWLRHRRMAAPFDLAETVFSRRKSFFAENECYHQILHPKIDLRYTFLWVLGNFHFSPFYVSRRELRWHRQAPPLPWGTCHVSDDATRCTDKRKNWLKTFSHASEPFLSQQQISSKGVGVVPLSSPLPPPLSQRRVKRAQRKARNTAYTASSTFSCKSIQHLRYIFWGLYECDQN